MWIAQQDRLPTRSRLQSWQLQISPLCCLCSSSVETRDHLLLSCCFSSGIWLLVQLRLSLPPVVFRNWESLLAWIRLSTASSPSLLRKIAAQATIYVVWKQRNNMLHNLQAVPPTTIFKQVDRKIINTTIARRHRNNFRNLFSLWVR
ncbi:PREDICTED: uncharacterized protein LOC109132637 [Camelina sativa]|uniref:Uncharacterized protein LOC109132637 n=1 Tax=Camelina sativa TaxID=90675 RepID=A0ABM1RLR2_CAMSA|nr:PREDICTED: uncharacterized protein LOC109132637 [Camelina sativa]